MHAPKANLGPPGATSSTTAVGRYAPSPTGPLHLGNFRTALAAQADIRRRGGRFILRIEDTDLARNVTGAEQAIIDDLAWLGITFDEGPHLPGGPHAPYRQTGRQRLYLHSLKTLMAAGLVYPCTCSRKDLQSAASAPHGPDGPLYPGTCRRDLPPPQQAAVLQQVEQALGIRRPLAYSLRLRTDRLPAATYHDADLGEQRVSLADTYGDFVIFRRDALWAYQFVCAVDDALMGITRVVRGADLESSAPRQAGIISALGYTPPVYLHVPLAADAQGNRLSKRDGSQSVQSLQQAGLSRADVLALIADLPDVTE